MVEKRSISLNEEVAEAVDRAAAAEGVSFSAWLAVAAEQRLALLDGLEGLTRFESRDGSLSATEMSDGEARLRRLFAGVSLRGTKPQKK